jgi:hypothetical protein
LQKGETATKYSNVFDLKSGDVFLFQLLERDESVKLNLTTELAKGGHYYDMPQIREQLTQPPIPLLNNMKRFFLDEFKSIPDKQPNITKHLRAIIQDAISGAMQPGDYTADCWKELSSAQKEIQADLRRLGDFISLTLVDRRVENGRRIYLYLMDFKNATVLQQFVLDENNKVALIQSEGSERKPSSTGGGD